MPQAKVTPGRGDPFQAEIAHLTSSSAFLNTDRAFEFRDPVGIDMFGVHVKGEVVYVSKVAPLGIGVVFNAPAKERAVIEGQVRALGTRVKPDVSGDQAPGIDAFLKALESGLAAGQPAATHITGSHAVITGSHAVITGSHAAITGSHVAIPGTQPPPSRPESNPALATTANFPIPAALQGGLQVPPQVRGNPTQPPSPSSVPPGMMPQGPMMPGGLMPGGTIPPGAYQLPNLSGAGPITGSLPVLGVPGHLPGAMPGAFAPHDRTLAPQRPMHGPTPLPPHPPPPAFAGARMPSIPPPYDPTHGPMFAMAPGPMPGPSAFASGVFQVPGPPPGFPPLPQNAPMSGYGAPGGVHGQPMRAPSNAGQPHPPGPGPMPGGMKPFGPGAGEALTPSQPMPVGALGLAAAANLAEVSPEGKLKPAAALEAFAACATLLAGRPLVCRVPHGVQKAALVFGASELALDVLPFAPGLAALTASDRHALQIATAAIKDQVEPDAFGPPEPEPAPDHYATLEADGTTVRFDSFLQFVVQFRTSINQGALVVRAGQMPPGTQRTLKFLIPNVDDAPTVTGSVAFQGNGTIGFMLDGFDRVKDRLVEIVSRPPPKKKRPAALPPRTESTAGAPSVPPPTLSSLPAPGLGRASDPAASGPGKQLQYKGKFAGELKLKDIFEFNEKKPKSLAECGGVLVRILDYLFAARVQGIASIKTGPRRLKMWLHEGSIVFTEIEPTLEQDKLGRYLILQKKVSRSALQQGLDRAKELKQPLGRTLVGMGEIDPGNMNALLRGQIMERVFMVRDWTEGEIEIGAWSDPEVKTGLVMTSGKAIITNLLREQLRRATSEELDALAAPHIDRTVKIDLAKTDPAFGLKKKERRFYEKAALISSAVRDIPKATAVTVPEGLRLITLGRALGMLELGKTAMEKTPEERLVEVQALLTEEVKEIEEGSLFEALGVHWSAAESEIASAYKNRLAELKEHEKSPMLRPLASRAIAKVETAFRQLSAPDRRRAYRDETVPEDERKQASDQMLDQVELLLLKNDRAKAESLLRCAQDIYMTSRADALMSEIRG